MPLTVNRSEDSPCFLTAATPQPPLPLAGSRPAARAPPGLVHDADDGQRDLGHRPHLVGLDVPHLHCVVRSGAILRVQDQQIGDVGLFAAGVDLRAEHLRTVPVSFMASSNRYGCGSQACGYAQPALGVDGGGFVRALCMH